LRSRAGGPADRILLTTVYRKSPLLSHVSTARVQRKVDAHRVSARHELERRDRVYLVGVDSIEDAVISAART
jgi:hypothetical protein